ncbi:ATP-binding protein [Mesonia ostreae]|uniref:histidine kinase n=1 Tax=Mesonia ostreae TaxID=861110 RepID=A0ABU2KHT3_9FLAO|nr:ATP-binding protein [Mesonia ostreae]MDT0294234.1 ATP-binding protein [Mesonia ostreae]
MIKIILSFFLCFISYISVAQESYEKENNVFQEIPHLQKLLDDSIEEYYDYDFNTSRKLALRLLKESFDTKHAYYSANAYSLMAMNDEAIRDYPSAKEKYIKSNMICLENNFAELLMFNYNGIGSTIVLENQDYEKSESFYKKALHIADSLRDPFKYDIIVNIAWNRLDNKQAKKVTRYEEDLKFSTTINVEKHTHNRTLVSTSHLLLARYYGQMQKFALADSNFRKAIEVLNEQPLYEQLSEIYLYKSNYEKARRNYEKSYEYLNYHIKNKEKFIDEDIRKRLMIENARYKLNEYERALVMSNREKVLMEDLAESKTRTVWLYFVISFILCVVILIIFRKNKVKNKLIRTLNISNEEIKKAKKEAEIAAEIKAEFISNISHEIRTPLHGVVGITSLLLEESEISKKNKKLLDSLRFSGNYLLHLINNILFLNKIDRNKIKVKNEVIDLPSFLDHIFAAVQFSAKKHQCEVVLKTDANLPQQIISDSSILYEILLNLTENAIKFSQGSVRVEVNAIQDTNQNPKLQFKVIDNGAGIPKDKQEMIFDDFSQISMDKSIMEGTGIGLSIVKKLLSLMNSEIQLESEVGKGSIFFFEIACKEDLIKEIAKKKSLPLNSLPLNSLKGIEVIHIEDNRINRLVVEKFLATAEVNLKTLEDGQLGLEALQHDNWDIALIDINIPSLNGYQIAKAVREIYPTKPMIAVTASELNEIKEKAKDAGMTDVLIKPFSKECLLEMIRKYV